MESIEKFQLSYSILEDINTENMMSQFRPTEEDINAGYNPYENLRVNKYNPVYSVFFNMDSSNYNKIGFNNQYQIVDLETVKNTENDSIEKRYIHQILAIIGPYTIYDW